jgi:hypothetical protein
MTLVAQFIDAVGNRIQKHKSALLLSIKLF